MTLKWMGKWIMKTPVAARSAAALAALAALATLVVAVIAAALMTLAACGSSDPAGDAQPWLDGASSAPGDTQTAAPDGGDGAVAPAGPIGPVDPDAPDGAADSDWVLTGADARWPAYIPADIPPLEGNIRKIMQGSTSIRFFYDDLAQDQIAAYLALLQKNGFHLEYVVYVDERYPDEEAAQERIEAGAFDAVNISKGEYHMDISYGGGDTTLDLQTLGFEDTYPFTPERGWPADLAGVVPQPERCRIEGVYAQDAGGYQIVVTPQDDTAIADYVHSLVAAGYAPAASPVAGRPDPASDYPDVYARGDVEVTVDYSPSLSTMRLTVWMLDPAGGPAWPAELAGLVPQPEGSTIQMLVELGDLDWIIQCAGSGDEFMAAYAAQLAAAGFTETARTEAPGTGLVAVQLQRSGTKVDLSLGATGELTIRITDEP